MLYSTNTNSTLTIFNPALLSVVAGVLGNPIGARNGTNIVDFDDVLTSGLYNIEEFEGISNSPIKDAGGMLVVESNYPVRAQRVYSDRYQDAYIRTKWYTNNWLPWKRIDNFGYNSLAELSAGVAGVLGISSFETFSLQFTTETYVQYVKLKKAGSKASGIVIRINADGSYNAIPVVADYNSEREAFSFGFDPKLNAGDKIVAFVLVE